MNEEVSHVAQWLELSQRARNLGMRTSLDGSHGFTLEVRVESQLKFSSWRRIGGTYATLAELRAAISDYVAQERQAGRMKF